VKIHHLRRKHCDAHGRRICSCCFCRHNELFTWAWSSEGKQTETLQFDICRYWMIRLWNGTTLLFVSTFPNRLQSVKISIPYFVEIVACIHTHDIIVAVMRLFQTFRLSWLCARSTQISSRSLCHEKMTWCSAQKKSYDAWRSCRKAVDAEKYKFEIRIWTWSRVVEHNQNKQVHAEMSTSTKHSHVAQSLTEPYTFIFTPNKGTVCSRIFWNNWCSCHTNFLVFAE